ncbi:putative origin recognition complex, subunit 5-like protein [Cytidiella melzeri]|nr:putative origin recognition complex, subunit 5-like protein [Cytidiella melzeri]
MEQGYEETVLQLTSLITAYPPPFIYIHDPATPHLVAPALCTAFDQLRDSSEVILRYAAVDAVACFNTRLFYDTVLNSLAEWSPEWEQGCSNWGGPSSSQGQRYNESIDGCVHGIRAIQASLRSSSPHLYGKGKANGDAMADDNTRLVIFVERAERLKETMPDILVPLARLRELSRTEITVILLSDVSWEQSKPSLGAAPDPYFVDVCPLSKQATLRRLASLFPASSEADGSIGTYDPALRPFYMHFLATLYSVCSVFTTDPSELAYIAAAQWPGFVQPILDDHRSRDDSGNDLEFQPPIEDVRIRLTRLFTPSFTSALETLFPRLSFANAWAQANVPPPNLLSIPPKQLTSIPVHKPEDQDSYRVLKSLPRMAKFILVASFLASNNPAKTDMRMFGRGPDERKKRRKGGSPRKISSKNAAVKIPQRLLGPIAFPLDRMIAILGVLLEENDVDVRPPAPEFSIPGEYTEMETTRVAVFAQVMELAASHLLYLTSPHDRLEMSSTFKCGIGYDAVLGLARDIGVPIYDILWDPV